MVHLVGFIIKKNTKPVVVYDRKKSGYSYKRNHPAGQPTFTVLHCFVVVSPTSGDRNCEAEG
jgi:hypothetical protein